jgi:Protein kinase domain
MADAPDADDETRTRDTDLQAGTLARAEEAPTQLSQMQTRATAPIPTAPIPTVRRSHVAGAASTALEPGSLLRDRYVLEERIGQGAMGQVWRARDLFSVEARDRNPFVAIKVLLSEIQRRPDSFAAMHREASRTQKLAHPNIVTVYVLDRDEASGRAFIAMELLEGEPLDRVVKRRREEGAEVRDPWSVIVGMAEGLAYAHRRGIVHSDFKPGNVFLTSEGTPKILDFGIARAARRGEGGAQAAPDDDSVLSGYTERYAAPEVLAEEPPHTADDVFALGLVAYELLTGKHALGRLNAAEAMTAGVHPAPIKGLDRRQWRVIDRALAYRRADRWQDAGEFLEALRSRRRLHIALGAFFAILIATAGGLAYRNYVDKLPSVPFEALPQAQQVQVRSALAEGQEALRYVREHDLIEASADAADRFAEAYALHPRNPEAIDGLEAAADSFLDWWSEPQDPQRALAELRKFRAKSEYYAGYAPIERAIERLEKP